MEGGRPQELTPGAFPARRRARKKIFVLAAVALVAGAAVAFVFLGNAESGGGKNAFDAGKTLRALTREVGLREGDLILRHGNGLWSNFIREKNPADKRFSHVGIVARSGGNADGELADAETGEEFFVVHADCNAAGRGSVRKEPLAAFVREASRVGVFRSHAVGGDSAAVVRRAETFLGRPFDWKFDLADADALYCTELVLRAFDAADGNAPRGFSAGTVEIGGREIVPVDAFVAPSFSEQIFDSDAPAVIRCSPASRM